MTRRTPAATPSTRATRCGRVASSLYQAPATKPCVTPCGAGAWGTQRCSAHTYRGVGMPLAQVMAALDACHQYALGKHLLPHERHVFSLKHITAPFGPGIVGGVRGTCCLWGCGRLLNATLLAALHELCVAGSVFDLPLWILTA